MDHAPDIPRHIVATHSPSVQRRLDRIKAYFGSQFHGWQTKSDVDWWVRRFHPLTTEKDPRKIEVIELDETDASSDKMQRATKPQKPHEARYHTGDEAYYSAWLNVDGKVYFLSVHYPIQAVYTQAAFLSVPRGGEEEAKLISDLESIAEDDFMDYAIENDKKRNFFGTNSEVNGVTNNYLQEAIDKNELIPKSGYHGYPAKSALLMLHMLSERFDTSVKRILSEGESILSKGKTSFGSSCGGSSWINWCGRPWNLSTNLDHLKTKDPKPDNLVAKLQISGNNTEDYWHAVPNEFLE